MHIIHGINLELLLFLAQIFVLVWGCAAGRFPKRALGKATERGNAREMYANPLGSWVSAAAAGDQGQMWLPVLWALTFVTCDVINQKLYNVKIQLLEKTFGSVTSRMFLKRDIWAQMSNNQSCVWRLSLVLFYCLGFLFTRLKFKIWMFVLSSLKYLRESDLIWQIYMSSQFFHRFLLPMCEQITYR